MSYKVEEAYKRCYSCFEYYYRMTLVHYMEIAFYWCPLYLIINTTLLPFKGKLFSLSWNVNSLKASDVSCVLTFGEKSLFSSLFSKVIVFSSSSSLSEPLFVFFLFSNKLWYYMEIIILINYIIQCIGFMNVNTVQPW